jgi:Fur family transcriptional regulator, ferric uptake regulator
MKLSLNKDSGGETTPATKTGTTRAATERFRAYLRLHRLRLTRERLDLLEAALATKKHFGAEELLTKLSRRRPRVSRATTYRTLALLEQCGILRSSVLGRGRSLYERALGRGHHDHIVCASCGKIVEFYDPELEALQARIAENRGFRIHQHVHELFGTCRSCRNGNGRTVRVVEKRGRHQIG